MTVFEHPDWPLLLRHLFIRRGVVGVNGPRHRIEVRKTAPESVFAIHTACANCGRDIVNVRIDKRGGWTFNLSCPIDVDYRCARMPRTTAMCSRVRAAIEDEPPHGIGLFEEDHHHV